MVNNFAIGLTHLLLAIAAWRLVQWRDLDSDSDIGPVPAAPDLAAPARSPGPATHRIHCRVAGPGERAGAVSTSLVQTLPPGRTDTDA